jgi:predicted lipoprotein
MALSELVNRMAFTVENIRGDKLGRPIGADGDGTPQAETMESLPSGRSITDIVDNLRGIELLYFGDEQAEILGLHAYLVHRGYQFATRMKSELQRSREALEAIDSPFSVAIVEDREDVELCIDVLGDLQRLIQVDLISALSLRVRFNDNDGD